MWLVTPIVSSRLYVKCHLQQAARKQRVVRVRGSRVVRRTNMRAHYLPTGRQVNDGPWGLQQGDRFCRACAVCNAALRERRQDLLHVGVQNQTATAIRPLRRLVAPPPWTLGRQIRPYLRHFTVRLCEGTGRVSAPAATNKCWWRRGRYLPCNSQSLRP